MFLDKIFKMLFNNKSHIVIALYHVYGDFFNLTQTYYKTCRIIRIQKNGSSVKIIIHYKMFVMFITIGSIIWIFPSLPGQLVLTLLFTVLTNMYIYFPHTL